MIQQAHPALKVLLLEEDGADAEAITRVLQSALPCDVLNVQGRGAFMRALDGFAPDAIVSDHSAGQFKAPAALAVAQAHRPRCPFIVVTDTLERTAARCLKSGAADYVSKSDLGRLPDAIRLAVRSRAPLRELTERQLEVLHRLASGFSTREIARRLGLSIKTVETHRAHVMKRLKFRDFSALVRYAIRTGMISPNR